MKKIVFVASVALSIFLVPGCKNDITILAPYNSQPVVYGLLDQNETTHYIRVNRTYEGNGNAYTMAQQYDSINYPLGTITVQLQDIGNGQIVTLGDTTGIPLDTGTFSFPNQIIYKTNQTLNPNDQYKLIITNNKTGKVSTGTTSLLPDVNPTLGFLGGGQSLLTSTPISFSSPAAFATYVTWSTNSQALIYQLTFRFFYTEIDSVKKDTLSTYADWVFAAQTSPSLLSGYQMQDSYTGPAFLQFLVGSISPAGNRTIKRVPGDVEVMFTSGSVDFNTYIQLSQPSLNVNQQKPFFTDLTNAIGIFTSRHVQTQIKPLAGGTIVYLDTAVAVHFINFRSH